MCGIAGWVDFENNMKEFESTVTKMSQALIPRGPDASGIWSSTNAILGHRRLIVVDPSGGIQPMKRTLNGCTYVLTYNGELYNTVELRKELISLGHHFNTNSDTEVLLVSYIEWGEDCAKHLNGIFAFAVWDDYKKQLFMARDRFGVKPLFYSLVKGSLIFASEMKAMLAHPYIDPVVNAEGLAEIFTLGPSRTPGNGVFRHIQELKPAHSLLFDCNGPVIKQYWSLESRPHTDSLDKTIETVRFLVLDAIERQLVADVPVCTFLSGGLDSSAISALAAMSFNKSGRGQLHTYSIDYKDNSLYFKSSDFQPNEDSPWIDRMVGQFGTLHREVTIDTPQLVDALKGALIARDLPGMADVDSSLWLFCREVKKDCTVALSGECADEVFGGYPWFIKEDLLNAGTFPWSRSLHERTRVLSPGLINLINPREYVASRYEETLKEVPRLPGETPLENRRREMFYLNFTWFMATLLDRKDRMSMAHGLEVRVPFCDHRIVEYVWNIPWDMKFLDGREKGILRKALTGILPDDVLYRKKSPYPKTHNPSYDMTVRKLLKEILHEPNNPLLDLIDLKTVKDISENEVNVNKPWFGQLMATPQLFAYLIQVYYWFKEFNVSIN